MVLDHVCALTGLPGGEFYRLSLGRAAMPLFFVLAGHLAGRPRARHAGIFLIGLLLPVAAPWVDSPNVLEWYALGVVLLWAVRLAGLPMWLPVAVFFTLWANGWSLREPHSYEAWALWGLMSLGAMLPFGSLWWGLRLPRWLEPIGRHPIAWYVGHVLFFTSLVVLAGAL